MFRVIYMGRRCESCWLSESEPQLFESNAPIPLHHQNTQAFAYQEEIKQLNNQGNHFGDDVKWHVRTPFDISDQSLIKWGLCALRHGIQISMEAILACHPARSTEWLDCHPKSCELWRIPTGPIPCSLLQANWFTPKEELFRQLGWPALRWRREITSLTMFHKLLHSRPEPLSECLFQYASATSARSRRKPFQLLLPHTRTTRYRESFFYRSALLWNSLPHDIQSLKNSKSFRDALENHCQSYKFTNRFSLAGLSL